MKAIRKSCHFFVLWIFLLSACTTWQSGVSAPTESPPQEEEDLSTSELAEVSFDAWVLQMNSDKYFRVVDISTLKEYLEVFPADCETTTSNTGYLICTTEDKRIWLYYLKTRERVDTSIQDPIWFSISPTGRFIVSQMNEAAVEVFDAEENVSRTIDIREEGQILHTRLGLPAISYDGKFAAFFIDQDDGGLAVGILELSTQSVKILELEGGPSLGLDLNWAPSEPLLLMGASSHVSDEALPANILYIFDLSSNELTRLADFAYQLNFFGANRPIWSTDSRLSVLTSIENLCILNNQLKTVKCIEAPEGGSLGQATWIPSQEKVIFYLDKRGSGGALILLDPNDHTQITIIQDLSVARFYIVDR